MTVRKYDVSKEMLAIFDAGFYSSVYLKRRAPLKEALDHYINRGAARNWFPNQLFNSLFYTQQTGSLPQGMTPLHHYAARGAAQGISPHPLFDPNWYAREYEPEKSGLTPFSHFLLAWKSGNPTNPNAFFDIAWYMSQYGDEIDPLIHPLNHYSFQGWSGKYDTSPRFSSGSYLKLILDAPSKDFNPLEHYLLHGRKVGMAAFTIEETKRDAHFKKKFNDLIRKSDIIHFHHNDKFANASLEFINENFPHLKQCHLVLKAMDPAFIKQEFPSGDNVIELDYKLLKPETLAGKKLIFHSLTRLNANFLYENPFLLASSYWMAWGYDLYPGKNVKTDRFVRENIYAIGSFSDNAILRREYGENHRFFETNLTVNPLARMLPAKKKKLAGKGNDAPLVIQINHSAHESTLEILNALAKFAGENIKIRTIASYGNYEAIPAIRELGTRLFGDRFSILEESLSPGDYLDYIAENDILILNQHRQQGSANVCTALSLGQKVFIRSEVTTSSWLNNLGATIYDSKKIANLEYADFIDYPEEIRQQNINVVDEKIYGTRVRIEEFKPVLEDKGYLDRLEGK